MTASTRATITVIATGPLTSDALAAEIGRLSQGGGNTESSAAVPAHLYFYDSISPIVEADSIDMAKRVPGGAL